jgi:hypothetical protein
MTLLGSAVNTGLVLGAGVVACHGSAELGAPAVVASVLGWP